MSNSLFDRKDLNVKPIAERIHDLDISCILELDSERKIANDSKWRKIAEQVVRAKEKKSAIIMMLGGHVIRSGVQNYLIDLMERGYISCLAMNGAGLIHDFEFSLIGATTESVARYIKEGQFGFWQETGMINDIVNTAFKSDRDSGMGAAVGRAIAAGNFPYKKNSLLAAAVRCNVPLTVHIGIGYDIIHEHPNFDGAASGALSYNDFLAFAAVVKKLNNGVIMDFGSAVMAPEVFLKSLSMARNIAHQQGKTIRDFTTVVCDLYDLPDDLNNELNKDNVRYYFRPWKTMLVRTLDGGESYYIRGKHKETIPDLWCAINEVEKALN